MRRMRIIDYSHQCEQLDGEGPLLAPLGCVIGLDSSIGGSIRNLTALNGILRLKPTCQRWSIEGVDRVMEGQDLVPFG